MPDASELSEHKRGVAAVYNLASPGYDKPALRFFSRVANRLVELTGIRAGQTVLDVATGTGAAALVAARAVGPSGRVVGVDIAADMLTQARGNAQRLGVKNVEFRHGDAERLDFRNGSFDVVICSVSIFFLPDMLAGPREWSRVTRNGGRIAFSAFGEPALQPLSDLFEARIRRYGVTFPVPRRPFSWQRLTDPERCRALLQDVGCKRVQVWTEQLGYYLSGPEQWWDIVWNSGFRGAVSRLAAEKLELFKTEHLAEVSSLATGQGIWLDVLCSFAVGDRPPAGS